MNEFLLMCAPFVIPAAAIGIAGIFRIAGLRW